MKQLANILRRIAQRIDPQPVQTYWFAQNPSVTGGSMIDVIWTYNT